MNTKEIDVDSFKEAYPLPDNDLLERLRKIKALADEAQDDHECQTAMLMFQRLLTKNGLDVVEIDVPTPADEPPAEVDVHSGQRIDTWMHYLHCVIANHFGCVPVTQKCGRGSRLVMQTLLFIGHSRDTTIAAQAFTTALAAADRLYSRHQLRAMEDAALSFGFGMRAPDKPNRGRYMLGFADGLQAAYRQQEAESTFDIILTTPADVLAAVAGFANRKFNIRACKQDGNTEAGYGDGFNVGRGDRLTNMEG